MHLWKRNLCAAWIAQLIAIVGFNLVFPFIPFYIQELGITDRAQVARWAGLLAGIPGLTLAIFSPIWGYLADRYGRKIMVERAMFGGAIVTTLMGFATNVHQLLALRILQGTLTGTVVASTALVATTTPRERLGFSLGLMQMAVFLGFSVGPLLGGILADFLGYRYSFYATGTLFIIAGLIILFMVKEGFQPLPEEEISEGFWGGLWTSFSSRQILVMILVFFLIRFSQKMVNPIFPLFVQSLAKDTHHIASITGALLALTGMMSALSSAAAGGISSKVGYKNALIISVLGAGIFYLPQAFAASIFHLLPLRVALGLFSGAMIPTANAIIGLSVSHRDRGKIYGISASASSIGNATGPIVGGMIASILSLRATFIFAAVLLMLAAIWIAIYLSPSKKHSDKYNHKGH